MCGFTIFISKKNNIKTKIDKKVLIHRGPDNFKKINYKNTTFAHWRLSIVDHSKKSNQPLNNNQYIFVYNGEIYDFKNLSRKKFDKKENSDTNFLFKTLIKKKNLNEITNYSGFYSYAYMDKIKKKITFSRDILGKKPLFYYLDNEKFILSSEEKGILQFIKKEIDKDSIFQYFFFKNIFHEKTFFKNVKNIPPGAKLDFDIKKWSLRSSKSWDQFYNQKIFKGKNISGFEDRFYHNLCLSVKKRNICDVKTQLALSGGYDSNLILNLIKLDLNIKNFDKSISIGFDKKNDETLISQKVSNFLKAKILLIKKNKFNLKNLETIIKYYDAPLEHPSSIGLDVITKEARKTDKVLITGEGADDLLFGYDHYKNKNTGSFAFRHFLKNNVLQQLLLEKQNLKILKRIKSKHKINFYRKKALKSKFFSRELEVKTHMQTLLKRNDRISMKNSVEIRCPFLDINIIKLIPSYKFFNKKKFLKKFINPKILRLINKGKKIGFYIPLSPLYNSNKKKFNFYLTIANNYLLSKGLLVNKKLIKNDEIKWVMLNIGIFLHQNN